MSISFTGSLPDSGDQTAYGGVGGTSSSSSPTASASSSPAASSAAALQQLGLPADASASDTYAAITQQQWQTYLSTFVPIENQLIQYATDPSQVSQSMSAASTDVNGATAAQAGSTQRNLSGLGATLNPAQQQASTRETGISAALANVQGQNMARDLTIQTQQGILGNPAPTAATIAQQATILGS